MKKKCLLIPGNPAVASYYLSWINEIENQNKNIEIAYSTSYVVFDRKLSGSEYAKAIIEHHEKSLLALPSSEKITIIGHCIGGYIALKLLEKYPERIEKIIILFPYIGYSEIPSLRFIRPFNFVDRHFPLVEILARYKNVFQKWKKEVVNIPKNELIEYLRFGLRQCTYFTTYKFDPTPLSLQKDKIHFLYIQNDEWCPSTTIELLKPISHPQQVAIPHDFIVDKDQRQKMTDVLLPYLGK
jgi:pimeloyl-ACP methyl ester carboxylesterase